MCNCGKTPNTYNPQFRQVLTKDRFGKVVIQRIPIPNPKLKKQMKKLRQEFLEKKNAKTLEDEVNFALK